MKILAVLLYLLVVIGTAVAIATHTFGPVPPLTAFAIGVFVQALMGAIFRDGYRLEAPARRSTEMILRVGRKVGRTIYDGDKLIGVMDTPELARLVVDAVNGSADRDRVVEAAIEHYRVTAMSRPDCSCPLCEAVRDMLALTAPAKEGSNEDV